MNQQPQPTHQYIPSPPEPSTIREFFSSLPDSQFGIELSSDNHWAVAPDHPIATILIKQIIQQWCDYRGCNIVPKRNQFLRFECQIYKVSPIDGSQRLVCHRAHQSDGQACFLAMIEYERLFASSVPLQPNPNPQPSEGAQEDAPQIQTQHNGSRLNKIPSTEGDA